MEVAARSPSPLQALQDREVEGGRPQAAAPEVEEWTEVVLQQLEAYPRHPSGFHSEPQILPW